MTRILMVAADAMEFPGILRHATGAAPAKLGIDWARSARLGNYELLLAANGMGAQRAAAAVDAALHSFRAEAIVSTGFCGALEPDLAIGDVVVGTAVSAGSHTFPSLCPASERRSPGSVACSIDHVAQTAEEKRRMRAGGQSAVEMEAGGVAERTQARGVPFYCVRVVTDLADEDMANNFNQALRPDGHFATINILRGALRNPLVRLPELLRLRKRCARAAGTLGDYCRLPVGYPCRNQHRDLSRRSGRVTIPARDRQILIRVEACGSATPT
jgi:adenosylhomocysteine nucleosidase